MVTRNLDDISLAVSDLMELTGVAGTVNALAGHDGLSGGRFHHSANPARGASGATEIVRRRGTFR